MNPFLLRIKLVSLVLVLSFSSIYSQNISTKLAEKVALNFIKHVSTLKGVKQSLIVDCRSSA